MSDSQNPFNKQAVGEKLSALASRPSVINTTPVEEDSEDSFVLKLQQLGLTERTEKHSWRKGVLGGLFALTFAWLFVVVVFVSWTGLSPTIVDRQAEFELSKQIHSQQEAHRQAVAEALTSTQSLSTPYPLPEPRSISFCPILFHLSDSVLIAFITSTTVAVLGLFHAAAKWLYGEAKDSN